MKKVQLEIIMPCDFPNKNFIRHMACKKGGIFLGTKNHDNIMIFHLHQRPLFIKEFTCLVGYSGGIFSKQQSFKN
jgi:hypothetical protein